MEITYNDFFLNIKELPLMDEDPDSPFMQLVNREIDRCMGGVSINGVFFSGWLYWHLNHWWIRDDYEDQYGNTVRDEFRPSLRDNEWIVAEYLEQCRVQKKGYMHIGVRQFGKSEIMASYMAYHATLFRYTQNVVVGGNDDDLGMIRDKIDFGLGKVWEGLRIPKLDKDVRKNMVRLGYKSKIGDPEVWSYLIVRNVAEGKNTEGPAGVTAKAYATDEVGKFAFAQSFEAAKPAFVSKFGWRCVPLLFGTGGSFDKGADAERFFYHPDNNNLLAVTDPDSGKKTAIFMSGLYKIDCKEPSTLGAFLIKEGKLPIDSEVPELDKIAIQVSNKERALESIKQARIDKAGDPDHTEYLKQIMYYPLTPKECFLSSAENFFNTDLARHQRERLEIDYPGFAIGTYVDLVDEGEKVIHKPSVFTPITSHPKPANQSANCPVVILEHPIHNAPYGLYVVGIDPYRFERADNSDSLGAAYVFKRSYDALGDTFQDMFVAWYVARPESKDTWNSTVRNLIKYYHAMALCENDEMSFIDYMISKGDGHLLMDTPDWIKEYNPTSSANIRLKGVSSSPKNIELFNTDYKQYMEEHFHTLPIPGEDEGRKLLGVAKIMDPALLEETVKWNKDGNFDRIRAASIAITAAKKLDTMRVTVDIRNTDPRFTMPKPQVQPRSVFKETTYGMQYSKPGDRIRKLMK